MRAPDVPTGRPAVTWYVAALVGPTLVTLLAIPDGDVPTTVAALLYVLVVAAAAAMEGAWAGVTASFVSFLALNFFFTPPLHTFGVGKLQDLIALVVFLLVSVITGLLLSRAVREKAHAETREQQARLTNQFTNRLLSGKPLEDVVGTVAQGLHRLLELGACEIETSVTSPVRVSSDIPLGDPFEVDLIAKTKRVGVIRSWPPASRGRLDEREHLVLQNVGGQLSLALESTRLAAEVQAAQLDAETNRLRAALFSGVTHDLKTPLSAITASVTSLLEGTNFNEIERYEHLDTIRQEAEHLNRVVTNLMDLARLRAGALVPARVPASMDELIEAVVARLRPMLEERSVNLNLHEDLPEMAIDVVQIDQVLTNLIENAVKFSPRGTPITISAAGAAEKVRVTVADKGPGIPLDDRERIFQPFERGMNEVAGTGLGLAIARAAVIAHGGRMWAQDGPGGGAAITFELPTAMVGAS